MTVVVLGGNFGEEYVGELQGAHPGVTFTVVSEPAELESAIVDADALIGGRGLNEELIAKAAKLRWYHHFGVGVDNLPLHAFRDAGITVTNNRTVRSSNIAEHVLAMMLGFARGLPEIMRYQVKHEWHHADRGVFEIGGQTLGVVGVGSIGSALVTRATALGMRVLGYRRNSGTTPEGAEQIYSGDQLHEMLGQCDHVAICLPLTPATGHMFSSAEFEAMKSSAYIYNIGRGRIIDQDALVQALQDEQIAGAGLDVTDPEPLPEESPLWDMTNVQITCHTSGATPFNWDRTADIVSRNLSKFLNDEELDFLVDLEAGY